EGAPTAASSGVSPPPMHVRRFVGCDVETVFLYPWAMSFDVLGVSVFLEAFLFVLILMVGCLLPCGISHQEPDGVARV
ncbi:NADH-quinone oxidoreductase subunit A, partial [Mycobacterium tuberculosis]|nr:NADH-quinone oxidoreductase subunit A [Mycobacterium tuberculosis]